MPLITRLFIKSGMIFFVLSLITGVIMQFEEFTFPVLLPLFWHMLMLGWITQIIMGLSLWMFPGRKTEESFRNQIFAWLAFSCLNTGLILRVITEPFVTYQNTFFKALLAVSAVLQVLAAVFYIIEIWPRVLSKKQSIQKRKEAR
ncbi:MAG: hypothetical protein WD016_11530 [Balneolaceae bacterium]